MSKRKDCPCDICSITFRKDELVFVAPDVMRQAVKNGFNPFKTPGIDKRLLSQITARFGTDTQGLGFLYADWIVKALADTTDWGLCKSCHKVVEEVGMAPLY